MSGLFYVGRRGLLCSGAMARPCQGVSVTGPRVWLASHSAGAGREQLVVKQYVMLEALPSFLASPCPMRGLGWPRSVTGPEV